MKLHLEITTLKHMQDFLKNVRPLDLQEAELDGTRFIDQPLSEFDNCQSLVDENDNVYAIGGILADIDGYGTVWMLCTTRVEQHKITVLRYTKWLLKSKFQNGFYKILGNKAWLNNQLHINWLTWMGAHWGDKTPDGQCRYFYFRKEKI